MRHRKSGLKLGKTASHRQSMFKNMVTSLFKYDRIRTTDVKAKELRRWVDHVITLAKRGDLHARRQVLNIIRDKNLVHELFESAAEKYSQRSGGYTRIVKIGRRAGDAAPISLIELIDSDGTSKGKRSSSKKKMKGAPATSAPSVVTPTKTDASTAEETVEETAEEKSVSPSATVEETAAASEEENLQDDTETKSKEAAEAVAESVKNEDDTLPAEAKEGDSTEDEKPTK